MRAAVYHGIGDIRIEVLPRPRPGPGEALLRVGATGICGTDLRILSSGHHRIPRGTARVLGHELAGEVVEVGEWVSDGLVGRRVAVAPNIGCGTCTQCVSGWTNLCPDYQAFGISLDGGFAEYMLITAQAIRQGNVAPIPDHVTLEEAALAEPLSCCLNGQEAVALGIGDAVLVVGAGPVGAMHVVLARLSGARTVIVSEPIDSRLKRAARQGADILVNPEQDDLKRVVLDSTGGQGVEVVVVATSSPQAQAQALELAGPRGRVNFFGGLPKSASRVRLDSNLIHYRQLIVTGTTGSNIRQYRAALDLIAAGRVKMDALIDARFPLDRFHEGVERSIGGQEMRILVQPFA